MKDTITEIMPNGPPPLEIEVEAQEDILEQTEEENDGEEVVEKDCETVQEQLAALREEMHVINEACSGIGTELERLWTDDSLVQDLHTAHKTLSEAFHEREVLYPVFHTLIGIADRCYQQIAQARNEQAFEDGEHPASRVLAREADLLEIESRLADFGVQRYLSTKEDFNAKLHKCVQRLRTGDASRTGRIASRLLPGYRRNGKIVRPECVSVYVSATKEDKEGGEMTCQ